MILIISPTYGIDSGGNGKSALLLFSRLRKLGQEAKVCVVNTGDGANYDHQSIDHIKFNDRNPYILIALSYYLITHRDEIEKVIIMNGWLIFGALLPCRFLGLPIFYWGNNFKPFCANTVYYAENMCESCTLTRRATCTTMKRAFIYGIMKMLLRSKEIIFLSFSDASQRLAKMNARVSKVFRVTNLTECELEEPQINHKLKRILVIGTFEAAKGSLNVVDFYNSFLAERENYELIVIGRVIDTTAYEQLSNKKNVYFLGELDNAEVMNYLDSSSFLLHLPTYLEPFARVWLEAAAKRCVIISSEIPSAIEILGDNVLYYPSGEREICSALESAHTRNVYIKRSRLWYDSLHSNLEPLIQSHC
jgi:glycosyltransferase involved in cell wall biosynthesis